MCAKPFRSLVCWSKSTPDCQLLTLPVPSPSGLVSSCFCRCICHVCAVYRCGHDPDRVCYQMYIFASISAVQTSQYQARYTRPAVFFPGIIVGIALRTENIWFWHENCFLI